jgi:diguanylate cyclase (GGDEF)-like protein/PAS domain S-box-containing protein
MMTLARNHVVPGLIILVSALVAVNIAILLSADLAVKGVVAVSLALIALSLTAVAVLFVHDEQKLANAFKSEVISYRQMIDEHFLVSKVDADGRFLEANQNLLHRTGYSADELASRPFGGRWTDACGSDVFADMWDTVRQGRTWSGEYCEPAKDGSPLWIKAIIVPGRNARGGLDCLTTIGVDVTEQRIAELQLKTAHARLEAFIKHVPAAVAMFDTEMRYVAHTDRWLHDYNLGHRSLAGRGHYDVFPEIPQRWRDKHQRILAGSTENCDEERFQRHDGSENVLRWEVRPWYLPDRSIGGMIMLTEEITERKKMQDELWRLVKLDNLTGLPNRLLFTETLRDEIRVAAQEESPLAVALVDIDNFKDVNDTLGHEAGDELLKIVARRLESALGSCGHIARLSADEFAVLIRRHRSAEEIEATLARVADSLEAPIQLAETVRVCSASIGYTVFPVDARDSGDLLKNADLALYHAKSTGRGRLSRFTSDLRAAVNRRVEMREQAVDALKRDEFVLYFQPILSADRSLPPSFEALLRWNHPVHGLLAPGSFEDVLEDPKVATSIGERVVDLALEQAAAWQEAGVAFGRVAVNVTSADFALRCFVSHLEARLDYYGVSPERICIEVTERVFLGSGTQHVGDALRNLAEIGVEIALDDFGTGYASLSHIKAYPIGRLKIDRSFVSDMEENNNSLSIVQAIVQLGRSLGVAVTAEGVEKEEQGVLLTSMGCGSLQGYHFSKPKPASELAHFLSDSAACEEPMLAQRVSA